jgi:hypothetical protein
MTPENSLTSRSGKAAMMNRSPGLPGCVAFACAGPERFAEEGLIRAHAVQ